jgi:putative copper export protein
MHKYIILLHVLAATVWVGGHLVLAIGILPSVVKYGNIDLLNAFEAKYEKVGIPALIILVVTGFYMAISYLPISEWFDFSNNLSKHISIKIILLGMTIGLALHARLKLIPNLSVNNLIVLAVHIIAITTVAVMFVVTGLSFRLDFL